MNLIQLQLVTIISERYLKRDLVKLIVKLGAKGYTITDVEGEGSRGIRASEWEGKNVKIETIVSDTIADKIIEAIANEYFENYAVITYSKSVKVVRGDKYI
jgi:nitrogen regulatory protein P-II 2